MKKRQKKGPAVRTRDWTTGHEFAFSHDRARHRKAASVPAPPEPDLAPEAVKPNAVVVSHTGRWAFIQIKGREFMAEIDGRLGRGDATVLAPGDEILVEFADDTPIVRGIAPRRSKLSRLAHVNSALAEQIIAANVDLLVVVAAAARPNFKPGLVDRYLIAAQVGNVEPVLVVNKMDLVDAEPNEVHLYREIGMSVFATSCETGEGIEALRAVLAGKLSVVAGHSGVGKSSLLNALDPSIDLATQEVSQSNEKGRHTTANARLHTLSGGIRVIDTPGARNLGVWNVSPEEVAYYFPELAEAGAGCRFRDCTHTHEPGCAVRQSVEAGGTPEARYASYLRIRDSLKQG
ncbi:MAG: ribosome small subunit-dependent GTPase A [Candidatus Hydrogenedentes bacterium]|nr:ribosome small subunit-dependent GTPase A [Candidatus Hydrogenedentota bacterium]